MDKISIKELVKVNNYKPINDVNVEEIFIEENEIARPGLSLIGETKHLPQRRVMLFGLQEFSYLENVKEEHLKKMFKLDIPLIIFTRNNIPNKMFLELAQKNNVPVYVCEDGTSKVFKEVYEYLTFKLAPETQVHGVFLDVYGKGVLIKGKSGIGKSEVALELIKKGHYLVADDMVILKNTDTNVLIGEAPELLQNKMEIRGIGIVDIQKMFGVTSVLVEAKLDLIINLTDDNSNVDRIGNDYLYEEILGVKKKKLNIPILKGKNISNLIEVAVANFQLSDDYGYNSSEEFVKKLDEMLIKKRSDDGVTEKI